MKFWIFVVVRFDDVYLSFVDGLELCFGAISIDIIHGLIWSNFMGLEVYLEAVLRSKLMMGVFEDVC
jgi:hypothetical protein